MPTVFKNINNSDTTCPLSIKDPQTLLSNTHPQPIINIQYETALTNIKLSALLDQMWDFLLKHEVLKKEETKNKDVFLQQLQKRIKKIILNPTHYINDLRVVPKTVTATPAAYLINGPLLERLLLQAILKTKTFTKHNITIHPSAIQKIYAEPTLKEYFFNELILKFVLIYIQLPKKDLSQASVPELQLNGLPYLQSPQKFEKIATTIYDKIITDKFKERLAQDPSSIIKFKSALKFALKRLLPQIKLEQKPLCKLSTQNKPEVLHTQLLMQANNLLFNQLVDVMQLRLKENKIDFTKEDMHTKNVEITTEIPIVLQQFLYGGSSSLFRFIKDYKIDQIYSPELINEIAPNLRSALEDVFALVNSINCSKVGIPSTDTFILPSTTILAKNISTKNM